MKRFNLLKVRCTFFSVLAGMFIFAGFFIMCILDTEWINISLWGSIMLASFAAGALSYRLAQDDKTEIMRFKRHLFPLK